MIFKCNFCNDNETIEEDEFSECQKPYVEILSNNNDGTYKCEYVHRCYKCGFRNKYVIDVSLKDLKKI